MVGGLSVVPADDGRSWPSVVVAALAVIVDVLGFEALVKAGLTPSRASLASSVVFVLLLCCAPGIVRAAVRYPRVTVALLVYYGLGIAAVSWSVGRAVAHSGSSILMLKFDLTIVLDLSAAALVSLLRLARARGAATTAAVIVVSVAVAVVLLTQPSSTTRLSKRPLTESPILQFGHELASQSRSDVIVGGLGSSVGFGATLPDPATQAPVAVFAQRLRSRFDQDGLNRWRVVNDSMIGSTIFDGLNRDWPRLAAAHPDIVVLAYGMNDGAPLQFNSGETYPGAMLAFDTLLREIRASGAIPVVLTSPHPEIDRFGWNVGIDPLTYPFTGQPMIPATAVVKVRLTDGALVQASERHLIVNEGMREVARRQGVDVVDAEEDWFRAVARYGDAALFDPTEFVHPNLLGHESSYGLATTTWLDGLTTIGTQRPPAMISFKPPATLR